jgi:hypothetical protein
MFLSELEPVFKELVQQPVAFTGGFVSGQLRIKISSNPLKSWLEKQGVTDFSSSEMEGESNQRPQSIAID